MDKVYSPVSLDQILHLLKPGFPAPNQTTIKIKVEGMGIRIIDFRVKIYIDIINFAP